MDKLNLLKEITEKYFHEDFYRFDLKLPKKIIGNGRTQEMYIATYEVKPWVNGDCCIPIEYLEGALIKEKMNDKVIISFVIGLRDLVPFINALWKELKNYDYYVELMDIGTIAVGDEA